MSVRPRKKERARWDCGGKSAPRQSTSQGKVSAPIIDRGSLNILSKYADHVQNYIRVDHLERSLL
ncbi:Uncharacterized protein DAT39_002841 [Clarias magur]|uniref:Uncharacterized protein n=1 Tax=Clarias magur TaxID=1594786 RepID=A0A8J4XA74_CLAMG|nr:Uncharacterized protein DAT39_002841 [Clarias magur]